MESPVFELKEEPASPLWELELLDEVEGIWEGDVDVIDEAELSDDNAFWGQADISDIIGKEEQILGLELDDIVLEDDLELKEGTPESFYPPSNGCRTGMDSFITAPQAFTESAHKSSPTTQSYPAVCTDPYCAESVCTDSSCCENVCNGVDCGGRVYLNSYPISGTITSECAGWVTYKIATESKSVPCSHPTTEPFTGWLDSGAIYDGSNSAVSGLPSFNPPGLWTAPESPSDEKAAAFPPAGHNTDGALPISSASADLFKEFEDVLSQAAGSLTPPDSPRSANGNVLLQLPANLSALPMSPASSQGFIMLQDMASSPVVSDQLDELVAETYQKNSGAVAPAANEKSPGRPWDSPSASSSGSCDSGYEDPDWSQDKSAESSASRGNASQSKKLRVTSTEERRLRKKEQNKNAATRYRMKKKMEMEEIIGEEKELLDRNENLKSEVVEITREIKYLKGLMGDLFRAKGLIKSK